jgi:hypothetical protein
MHNLFVFRKCACANLCSPLPPQQRGKVLPDYATMRGPGSSSTSQGMVFQSTDVSSMLAGQAKLAADVATVEWLIETAKPLTAPQHPKFQKMMQAASGGTYKGCCYDTVSSLVSHLAQNGKDASSAFITELKEGGTLLAVTADLWSNHGKGLLGITGSGITPDWKLRFVLVGAVPVSDTSHTGELVDKEMDKAFQSLGFHDAQSVVFTSVSDNGSNMIAGLSAGKRIPCGCHTIELSVKRGVAIPAIDAVVKKACRVVAHFCRSTIGASRLKELQLKNDLKKERLIRMVLTRWRSTHAMSKSIVANKPPLEEYFSVHDEGIDDAGEKFKMTLESVEFRILDQLSSMLQTSADASQILEGDKYPTIGCVLAVVGMVIESMRPGTDVTLISSGIAMKHDKLEACVRAARAAILLDLQERWVDGIDDHTRRTLLIGSQVDPRFKNLSESAPEFSSWADEAASAFEFELMSRWVPDEPEEEDDAEDSVSPAAASGSLKPASVCRSGGISMSSFFAAKVARFVPPAVTLPQPEQLTVRE